MGHEFGGAGVHCFIDRNHVQAFAFGPDIILADAEQPAKMNIGKAHLFGPTQQAGR